MSRFMTIALAGLFLVPHCLAAQGKASDKKVELFRSYLKKNYAGKKWQIGPKEITSKAIRKAYPNRRFFYVFSAPPLPPGAPLKGLLDAYRKRMKEFRDKYLALTVCEHAKVGIKPLKKAADFNEGLMAVGNEADAKIAAAAVISLFGSGRVGPGIVQPSAVRVTKNAKGFNCTVHQRRAFFASALFDNKGRLVRVSKTYAGPLPP